MFFSHALFSIRKVCCQKKESSIGLLPFNNMAQKIRKDKIILVFGSNQIGNILFDGGFTASNKTILRQTTRKKKYFMLCKSGPTDKKYLTKL